MPNEDGLDTTVRDTADLCICPEHETDCGEGTCSRKLWIGLVDLAVSSGHPRVGLERCRQVEVKAGDRERAFFLMTRDGDLAFDHPLAALEAGEELTSDRQVRLGPERPTPNSRATR